MGLAKKEKVMPSYRSYSFALDKESELRRLYWTTGRRNLILKTTTEDNKHG